MQLSPILKNQCVPDTPFPLLRDHIILILINMQIAFSFFYVQSCNEEYTCELQTYRLTLMSHVFTCSLQGTSAVPAFCTKSSFQVTKIPVPLLLFHLLKIFDYMRRSN